MKEFFKDIAQDKTITAAYLINIFLMIATVVYILFSYGKLPPFIPIFNQLPWGEQRLGNQLTIFIPTLVALLIFAINIFASASIYKKIPLISRMLAAVSLLAGILTFLFSIKTIVLIT
ncbi:MAG: hypothetical protein Q8P29_02950 [Candidatus Levybacteria bacterium]|nr:hypothetical protein [Candidatus Levybacteria bacterium]MDZ4227946.1 hypothetical protein [Candidatus Levybacteria bacterium]